MTRIVDYVKAINDEKLKGLEMGKKHVEITAGLLHKEVNEGTHPTLPTCCMAMRKSMLDGDIIVDEPKTKSGFSNALKIRYFVHDLDSRAVALPSKPRGRKKGSTVKEKTGNQASMALFEKWLDNQQLPYSFEEEKKLFSVSGMHGTWLIHTCFINVGIEILALLEHANANVEKYSFLLMNTKENLDDWDRVPDFLKERLNISVLIIDKKGEVKEIS